MDAIYFYAKNDPYYAFSNFYSQGFELNGHYWPTVEHYFQAQKFLDADYRKTIRRARSPKQAKGLGQSRAVALRADWEEAKEQVMLEALRLKFSHAELKKALVDTGDKKLVEHSPCDRYWGCGWDGAGKNRLGALLMQVREEFSNAPEG